MSDEREQQDHWRELAELLGVEPEPQKASAPVSVAAPVEPARPERVTEKMPEETRVKASVPAERAVEEVLPRSTPASEELEAAPMALRERESAAPEDVGRGWEPRGDDRPRGGRHRGGRRGRFDEESESAPTRAPRQSPEAQALRAEEDLDEGSPEPLEQEPSEDLEIPPAAAQDDDIDEEDNLSDWTVPSWTELIASLYRPER